MHIEKMYIRELLTPERGLEITHVIFKIFDRIFSQKNINGANFFEKIKSL